MPELPEVETVRRGLQPAMEGAMIREVRLNRADLRFPFPPGLAARITGATVTGITRRAKYLLWHIDTGDTLIAHLGMSGSWRVSSTEADDTPGRFHHSRNAARAHDHLEIMLQRGAENILVTYNDPRRFGFVLIERTAALAAHPLIAGIGMEPLGNAFDGDALFAAFAGRRTSLKAALLDQKLIAGIGNIYACEALFAARLHPEMPVDRLARADGTKSAKADALAAAVRDVLARAIEAGGSTLRDHRQADGELGYFQHSFSVYGREGEACARASCDGVVKRVVQNGRSSFFCPSCQTKGGRLRTPKAVNAG
jgi:formamidopyrimidine-DNA glycosylase